MNKKTREIKKLTGKKRILVVEDDPAVMKLFNLLLTGGGYEVIQADNALPALFRSAERAPDLILADLNMPFLNGMELIDQLKGHVDTRDIPVVVVTGSNSEESRTEAFAAGCAGYLTKPIDATSFLAQIKEFLQSNQPQKHKNPRQ
jgi:CheY-like chemotaxis protein